ncbi:hypothetical protein Hanom_Chr10g00884241 [Helianthus anomalus]
MEKLHVLSFIFIPFCRRCPFQRMLTGFALYKEFCYTFCPLTLTQLDFCVKYDHVTCMCGYFCHFTLKD